MSKSHGNVVAPDDQVEQWGADAFRCQLMFVGPWDQGGPYNPTGMAGIVRWLSRLWSLCVEPPNLVDAGSDPATVALRRATHKTILAVTAEIEEFRFNTMISRLMEHTSAMQRAREGGPVDRTAWDEAVRTALLLTAPLAPHITEELWERTGGAYSIHFAAWPEADAALVRDDEIEVVVQVNGKVRDRLTLPADADEAAARAAVYASSRVQSWLEGKEPRRVIYVPGRLVNIVV
jgi:leucyl-tRNA synthetase